MAEGKRPAQDLRDGESEETNAGRGALIPMESDAQSLRPVMRSSRPNSVFVAHLLATAEQLPQTRKLRRASSADAKTAYNARGPEQQRIGKRTRQII